MPDQPAPKRIPLGPPIRWTEEELDALAYPLASDREAAAALWREQAPPELAALLDATEETDGQGRSNV